MLRPLCESDWDTLLRWNQDPEVLYFAEGDDVEAYELEQVQQIYRGTSQNAFTFMMELEGRAIGECWLQRMNLPRLLGLHPGEDLRRVDLMIGEKELWGRGLGTEAIGLLTELGFSNEKCDRIFACGIADYNPRSRGAFRKCGYVTTQVVPERPGGKARFSYDLSITKAAFFGGTPLARVLNTLPELATPEVWAAVEGRVEVVNAPVDAQVVGDVLVDFDVCCLEEGLRVRPEGRLKGVFAAGEVQVEEMVEAVAGWLEDRH